MSLAGPSPTLAANERVRARIAAGRPVVHLAFGEAGLPLHPRLARDLAAAARLNGYPPIAGAPRLREAVAGYFTRRRLATDRATVVVAPGSKPLLYALMLALPGDLILPRPAWVSYEAQARLAGKKVARVPIPEEAGGVPDPDLLEDEIAAARSRGEDPRVLLLTVPDNPTGTVAPREVLERVCAVARSEGLTIVSDEVYRDLTFRPETFASPAELYPEGTVVTAGVSKNLSLGGWRLGFARTPQTAAGAALAGRLADLASEIWSGAAAPVQEAVAAALEEPPEIVDFIAQGRALHQKVATTLHKLLLESGAACRPPGGAFYLYPSLPGGGSTTSAELAERLLEDHDIAVLPGEAFGDDPAALRVRMATSLLYGRDDAQRWEALRADDPTRLPWIGQALDLVRTALKAG